MKTETVKKTPTYLDTPYYSACGCKLEVIDGGLRTLFTRCPVHAAAPELLEALKNLTEIVKSNQHADGKYFANANQEFKEAVAAIAKAEPR
jgi:benzoyl-CoA reductase/2-hydroxyglutaryl-CoA dehydratase subunit BcrC/BadD/HgdB